MNHSRILTALVITAFGLALTGADSDKTKSVTSVKPLPRSAVTRASPATSDRDPASTFDRLPGELKAARSGQAGAYQLNWSSINSGGATSASSPGHEMGHSLGQAAAGSASSAVFSMGVGFWYGAGGSGAVCPVTMTGDVNGSSSITSADIIYCVNFVFRGGPAPSPCVAAADVNCNGSVTSADIIYLVNFVFRSGPAPCDVCTLIPGSWSCP